MNLCVTDISRQKKVRVNRFPKSATVGELIRSSVHRMGLPRHDSAGRALQYQALLQRQQRHLSPDTEITDLQAGDELVLQPNIDAGGVQRKWGV